MLPIFLNVLTQSTQAGNISFVHFPSEINHRKQNKLFQRWGFWQEVENCDGCQTRCVVKMNSVVVSFTCGDLYDNTRIVMNALRVLLTFCEIYFKAIQKVNGRLKHTFHKCRICISITSFRGYSKPTANLKRLSLIPVSKFITVYNS